MRHVLICTALAVGTATGVGFAKNHRTANNAPAAQTGELDQQARQALERHYPGAQIQVQGKNQEEGVEVYDVRITPKTGQPFTATVTQSGDLVSSGSDMGANPQNLPPAVQEFTQNIWHTPPADVKQMTETFYWVTLGAPNANVSGQANAAGSHTYALRFDPTGQLADIKSPRQLHQTAWQTLPDAPQDATRKLEQFAQQRFPNAKMQAVKQEPDSPGFYQVRFQVNGTDGWMIADANGNIAEEATTVPLNQLPQAVQNTIHQTFNGDRLVWAARDDMHFYQIRENVGNRAVSMRIQPDGDVMSVHSVRGPGQAVPAAAHQGKQNQK